MLNAAGTYVAFKLADGAIGEIGARGTRLLIETLRRIPTAVRRFAELSTDRKTLVSVRAKAAGTQRRWYPLTMPDEELDAATFAILEDLGVPVDEVSNKNRFWTGSKWAGAREAMETADREHREPRSE